MYVWVFSIFLVVDSLSGIIFKDPFLSWEEEAVQKTLLTRLDLASEETGDR